MRRVEVLLVNIKDVKPPLEPKGSGRGSSPLRSARGKDKDNININYQNSGNNHLSIGNGNANINSTNAGGSKGKNNSNRKLNTESYAGVHDSNVIKPNSYSNNSNNNSNHCNISGSSNSNNSSSLPPRTRTLRPATAAVVRSEPSGEEKERPDERSRWNFSSAPPDRDMLNIETALLRSSVESKDKDRDKDDNAAPKSPRTKSPRSKSPRAKSPTRATHAFSFAAQHTDKQGPASSCDNKMPLSTRQRANPNTNGAVVGYREDASLAMQSDAGQHRKWNIMTKLRDDEERMKPVLMQSKKEGGKNRSSFYEQYSGEKGAAIGGSILKSEQSLSNISVYR